MPIYGELVTAPFGVANMPGGVLLANKGRKAAVRGNASLREGLNMTAGVATYKAVADSFGIPYQGAENFIG